MKEFAKLLTVDVAFDDITDELQEKLENDLETVVRNFMVKAGINAQPTEWAFTFSEVLHSNVTNAAVVCKWEDNQ